MHTAISFFDLSYDTIRNAMIATNNQGDKQVKYYPFDESHPERGGKLRVEDESGSGFEVGAIHQELGSFPLQRVELQMFKERPTVALFAANIARGLV